MGHRAKLLTFTRPVFALFRPPLYDCMRARSYPGTVIEVLYPHLHYSTRIIPVALLYCTGAHYG
jgi:hypothetical protein